MQVKDRPMDTNVYSRVQFQRITTVMLQNVNEVNRARPQFSGVIFSCSISKNNYCDVTECE